MKVHGASPFVEGAAFSGLSTEANGLGIKLAAMSPTLGICWVILEGLVNHKKPTTRSNKGIKRVLSKRTSHASIVRDTTSGLL